MNNSNSFMNSVISNEQVLIVVPAFNESESISHVLAPLVEFGYSVLVVNDGSTDDTSRIAMGFGVAVLDLPINLGVGGALRAGFQHAVHNGFEAVIQVDADGQHPAERISELISASNDLGASLVIGSRFLGSTKSMSVSDTRRFAMRVLAWTASRAAGTTITDATSGFRIIRQPLLKKFSKSFSANYLGDTYEAIVVAGRAGFIIREISAPLSERLNGKSSSSSFRSFLNTTKVLTVAFLRLHPRL